MKLQVPFIQLPISFDAAALAEEVAALGETPWRPHPQGFPGNSMLPLVAADGDPANEAFAGPMRPTPALQACGHLKQVIASLGATVGRSRLMRLAGNAEVTRHVDQGYYWAERVRVHVPIVTQPTVRFECGDAVVNMAAGECWIFDTWRQHRVLNDATASRIHLVVDTVGGEGFWELVARGRAPGHPSSAPWQPRHVAVGGDEVDEIACEQLNVPRVMSPWELNALFGILFADAAPGPAVAQVQQITLRFIRAWRALWARFGDADPSLDAYRARLQQYLEEVRMPAQAIRMNNHLDWYGAMTMMIGRVAVAAPEPVQADAVRQRAMGDNA
ncbi:aspartyl/asparaginyl beta-hydroxylase domain-containing protein [Marilutibacter chinensis]|uniref:Aspartyl/asparaginyl beta-hydroxylase domain-containing protein n=1 Tax=Marilutibacter chinensis TaxID=2912247 RepID=A0ABS9HY10_9GAMM|nr:aspartyl/asparaginyl beta-hydroxylase domain-containing protein [Lysobacter chinensis]MCF7223233.1 aspartyl/asparaginyl beta-hydroxylase domain-containing protein [Lysobacter chinensis]